MTYERLEETGGLFWPVPSEDHPARRVCSRTVGSSSPTAEARFSPVEWGAPTESEDDEYPMLLTTGRTVAHFLSGNQTRRIGTLVEQTPRPWVEVHSSLGFVTGDPVRVVTRRGNITFPALVTDTIRADTVFVPYHWAKRVAANLLTIDALHPISKIPEYKVCACRIERGDAVDATHHRRRRREQPPGVRDRRRHRIADVATGTGDRPTMMQHALHRPGSLHRMPGVRRGVPRVRLPPRQVDDPPRLPGRRCHPRLLADRVHALRGSGRPLRGGVSRRRDPGDCRRRRPAGGEGTLHRMRELRPRVPIRVPKLDVEDSVQVQPLLRPHLGRPRADVCVRLPDRLDLLWDARGTPRSTSGAAATDIVVFGEQEIRTGVATVTPRDFDGGGVPGGMA